MKARCLLEFPQPLTAGHLLEMLGKFESPNKIQTPASLESPPQGKICEHNATCFTFLCASSYVRTNQAICTQTFLHLQIAVQYPPLAASHSSSS